MSGRRRSHERISYGKQRVIALRLCHHRDKAIPARLFAFCTINWAELARLRRKALSSATDAYVYKTSTLVPKHNAGSGVLKQ